MALAGRELIIVGRILLQDQPHPLHKIARVPPVTLGIEIAEEQLLLQPTLDRCDHARDLTGDERFASDWTLVVEENAVRGMHAVGLAVVDRDPVRVELRGGVRRAWIEFPGQGYEWSPAGGGSQVHRRWPCIPASRTTRAHAIAPRGCKSRRVAFPARCGSCWSRRSHRHNADRRKHPPRADHEAGGRGARY